MAEELEIGVWGWTKGEFEQEKAELRRSFRNLHRGPLKFLHIFRQESPQTWQEQLQGAMRVLEGMGIPTS